jgi:serine protease
MGGGSGVNVYILDSGIRTTHQEFGGRAVGAFTAINDAYGTGDCTGHGTHVAGTVGGNTYGVAKGVKLFSVRIVDCTNYGSYSGMIAGVNWVTQNRVLPAVANMSIAGSVSSALNSAIQTSIQAGVVFVAAAGNSATDACNFSPGSTSGIVTVGAVGNTDSRSPFSNYGSCVTVFAPGEAITSAWYTGDNSSLLMGGTSTAAPHVAGVAALYLAANQSAPPSQVKSMLQSQATAGLVSNLPAGTPNLLLYSQTAGVAPSPAPPLTDPAAAPARADQPPVASFTWSCSRGRCTFDGTTSTDDRFVVSYNWNFGAGGASASVARPSFQFTSAGTYTVSLTVADAAGQSSTKSGVVVIRKV